MVAHAVYQDLPEALAWLTRVFGFQEHFRYGQREFGMEGVQVFAGKAVLMLVGPRGRKSPMQLGQGPQFLTIFVEEVEEHFARSKREGATIVEPLHETVYGELQYGVLDLDGHLWLFSRHARDLAPGEWGAVVAGRPS